MKRILILLSVGFGLGVGGAESPWTNMAKLSVHQGHSNSANSHSGNFQKSQGKSNIQKAQKSQNPSESQSKIVEHLFECLREKKDPSQKNNMIVGKGFEKCAQAHFSKSMSEDYKQSMSRSLLETSDVESLRACTNQESEFAQMMEEKIFKFTCLTLKWQDRPATAYFFWNKTDRIEAIRIF